MLRLQVQIGDAAAQPALQPQENPNLIDVGALSDIDQRMVSASASGSSATVAHPSGQFVVAQQGAPYFAVLCRGSLARHE